MANLNKEERESLASYERGEWKTVKNFKKKKRQAEEYAANTFKKDKRINIRISQKDLYGIQKRALEEGLPYQTLIASVVHKYIGGILIEKAPGHIERFKY